MLYVKLSNSTLKQSQTLLFKQKKVVSAQKIHDFSIELNRETIQVQLAFSKNPAYLTLTANILRMQAH